MWAIEHWNVVPDVMVVAKSLSAGYAPIAAMVVREHVYEAFGNDAGSPSVQSYGGHGASSAAGAKALQIYVEERMDAVAEALGQTLIERLEFVRGHALVEDLRRLGSWLAIELHDPRTGKTLARGLRGHYDIARHVTRSLLDHRCAAARMSEGLLHISPPYVSTEDDIDFIVRTIPSVLDDIEKHVREQPAH
jgi:adenosylmethionine-8-amino-7-oxononanoate aminotransferase